MDVRKKLVELLNQSFAEQYEKRGLLTAPHTATDLIAHGVTVQEWISVDEPPKKNGYYLVYTESGEITRGYYKGYYWLVGNDVATHWQPMPQPPKGE